MQTVVVLIVVILAGLGVVRHFVRRRQAAEDGGCGCAGCEYAASCRSAEGSEKQGPAEDRDGD